MEKEKKDRVLYVTHAGECLIWLLILLGFIILFSFHHIKQNNSNENNYKVFLNDVDGLIVGSPVRMMGIEIGHVAKIKPINNEVYVNFVLTHPDIHIPQGSEITVEFTGLGGSKSLEIYPPDDTTFIDKNTPIIIPLEPKRLNETIGLFSEMYKKFISIIIASTSFGNKLENADVKNMVTSDMKEIIQDLIEKNLILDEYINKINEITSEVKDIDNRCFKNKRSFYEGF